MRRPETRRPAGWKRAAGVLVLCLSALSAFAEVSDKTIDQIVQLRVKIEQDRFLYRGREIDSETVQARRRDAEDRIADLSKYIRRLPPDQQRQINSRVDSLVAARVQSLQPQWESQHRLFEEQQASNDRAVSQSALMADVRMALEPVRRRIQLQQQRDGGDISADTYTAEDGKALAELAAIRRKYVAQGPVYAERFDRELKTMADAVAADAVKQQIRKATPTEPYRPQAPRPSDSYLPSILVWLAGIGGIFAFFRLLKFLRPKPAPQKPKSTVYGSAAYDDLEVDVADGNCLAEGIFFGKSSAPGLETAMLGWPGAPICSTPEHHTLIVARTRTGKGTRVIIPTLLRYSGSAFVIDPKGENAAVTARTRREQIGQNIHVLNPWNELATTYQRLGLPSATFNPLDILDRNDPNVVAIAQTLASAICPAPANARDKFWQGSAANVLTAVFLWLADRPEERKTLARAREIVSLTRKDFKEKFLIPMAASEAFSGAIREMAAPFIDLADETYSGVMSNLSESTKFLSDPQIKAATAESSFAMEDLALGTATVYVVIPTERMDTQKTWLRLVIIAAMHIFKYAKRRTRHRCLFLIDEFAALGRLDDLPRDIATMSGHGVDFTLIVQGLDQLKDHYGEAKGTILSNCAYKWFCNLNDLDSAKYLSETLGKATVTTTSTSTSYSASRQGGSQSSSTSHGETGRSLLNPDEILNLGRDVAIVIQPKGKPQYLRPVDYWNLGGAFAALREKYPKLYWEPPLTYDENPYVPGAEGTGGAGRGGGQRKTERPRARVERMTEERAREVLGVAANAGKADILAAYKRLMLGVHPDRGGSNYLAQEINAAKAFLVGE